MFARFRFAVLFTLIVLPSMAKGEKIELFNGEDFSGWTYVLSDENAKLEDVWSVEDGVIICKGLPRGYIVTDQEFSNYVLTLQWRWKPGGKEGNSGVLVHTTSPAAIGIWPKSIEAQLMSGNAGDIFVIGTTLVVENAETRMKKRRVINLTDDSEKPIGKWNKYEIICKGDQITLKVNGDLVNHCTNLSASKGKIALQSEGTEIHFRKIAITPLD